MNNKEMLNELFYFSNILAESKIKIPLYIEKLVGTEFNMDDKIYKIIYFTGDLNYVNVKPVGTSYSVFITLDRLREVVDVF